MQRINSHLHAQRTPPYVINLDPAVTRVPFGCNIDIRDSIDYREVMRQYRLGPNGGILTALNLFATKVDQIVGLLEKRTKPASASDSSSGKTGTETEKETDTKTAETTGTTGPETKPEPPITHVLIDTPGQIEVFVWSASGSILLDSLASTLPTVLAYIIDTPRTASTATFMSNMLYAISILYKTRLPMILVFNKTDVRPATFARAWMTDFEAFQTALRQEEQDNASNGDGGGGGSGYGGALLNSMSLVLEEFYRCLSVVEVSAVTGEGVGAFFEEVEGKRAEFERGYRVELERRWGERERGRGERRERELGRLLGDLNVKDGDGGGGGGGASVLGGRRAGKGMGKGRGKGKREPETLSDIESSSDDADRHHHDDNDGEDDEAEGEEEIPAELVDPDSAEEGDDDERGEDADGLTQRYRRAMADESGAGGGGGGGGGGGKTEETEKLARYLKAGGV